jgi:hypothetical protein
VICRLRCVNSVDCSTALGADLQWLRLICTNGMYGWGSDGGVRRVHRYGNVLESVTRQIGRRFRELPADRTRFALLFQVPVSENRLRDWVDALVARRWSLIEAARVWHICMAGVDGEVQDHEYRTAHELEFTPERTVPGACAPVQNVYHVGQALSWIAGQSEAVHTRISRTFEVPRLLKYLLN